MASYPINTFLRNPKTPATTATFRWPNSHRILVRRRRKLPTERLGGQKKKRLLAKVFRRFRLKWLKLQYFCMLKKLKRYYHSLIKDIIEASASTEVLRQRILMETSMVVPVMGVSFSSYPYGGHVNGASRSIFIL
ncbi:hypothetical protein Ancab_029330 [Ancistrocladus abbreviatus]